MKNTNTNLIKPLYLLDAVFVSMYIHGTDNLSRIFIIIYILVRLITISIKMFESLDKITFKNYSASDWIIMVMAIVFIFGAYLFFIYSFHNAPIAKFIF